MAETKGRLLPLLLLLLLPPLLLLFLPPLLLLLLLPQPLLRYYPYTILLLHTTPTTHLISLLPYNHSYQCGYYYY